MRGAFWTARCLIEINCCQGIGRDIAANAAARPLALIRKLPCHDSLSLQPASFKASSLALNHIHFSEIRPSHVHTLRISKQLSHVADSVLRVVEPTALRLPSESPTMYPATFMQHTVPTCKQQPFPRTSSITSTSHRKRRR